MSKSVVIHCKPEALNLINELELDWSYSTKFGNNEIDVIVPDVEYTVQDGYYQDPDEQLCEHYGINYDLVNCIEAV